MYTYFNLHLPAWLAVSIHTIYANSLSTHFTALFSCGFVVEATVAGPITLSKDRVAVIATRLHKIHNENQGKESCHNLQHLCCCGSRKLAESCIWKQYI